MVSKSAKIIQLGAYLLIMLVIVFILGITKNCRRLNTEILTEGNSGGDTLDIAILYGPSSMYLDSTDVISGINHDLALRFSQETGIPVKIWPVSDGKEAMDKTSKGIFDILASLPLDNEIKKNYLTTESIFLDRLVLLQTVDSISLKPKINSSLDLDGQSVWISSGSPAKNRLENLASEIGGKIEIIEEPDLSDELIALKVAAHQINYAVVNEKIVKKIADNYPDLSYESPVSFTQFQVWLFNPSDTLVYNRFSNWYEEFRLTDQYREILGIY